MTSSSERQQQASCGGSAHHGDEGWARALTLERQCELYWQAPTAPPSIVPEKRLEMFAWPLEPALQRELKHIGAANGNGSYSAELIGYVEISPNR
jgi:hypothetical protein